MIRAWLPGFDDAVAKAEDAFLALSHGTIASLVVVAVVFRYFLSDPLVWTEEFIVIIFGWMIFIGVASGFRERMHLRIDALLLVLPIRGRFVLGALATTATLATLVALAWFGLDQAEVLLDTQTPMMRISATWAVAALPVGMAFSCLHVLRHLLIEGVDQTLWPPDLVASSVEAEN